ALDSQRSLPRRTTPHAYSPRLLFHAGSALVRLRASSESQRVVQFALDQRRPEHAWKFPRPLSRVPWTYAKPAIAQRRIGKLLAGNSRTNLPWKSLKESYLWWGNGVGMVVRAA